MSQAMEQDHVTRTDDIVEEPNLHNPATSSSIETPPPQEHETKIDIVEESNLHNPATSSSTETPDVKFDGCSQTRNFGKSEVLTSPTHLVKKEQLLYKRKASNPKGKKMNDIRALFVAARNGNWQDAEVLLKQDPTLLHSKLTPGQDTVFHIASSANCSAFVKELINLGKVDTTFIIDLTLRNRNGDTAFSIAAASGFVDIARIMNKENGELPNLTDNESHREYGNAFVVYVKCPYNVTPLLKAVKGGHKKMATYLFPLTRIDPLYDWDRNRLFVAMVISEMHDIAIKMLEIYPELAYGQDNRDSNQTALHVLAQKPQDIASGSEVGTTIRYICSWICGEALKPTLAYQLLEKLWDQVLHDLEDEDILELIPQKNWKTSSVLFEAVKSGNVEFVIFLFKSFPDLIWEVDQQGRRLFHVAILYRQEKIFNLIYNLGAFKDYATIHIDNDGNNMLHMAGKLPPEERFGSSRPHLQMQRELLWFKEVEKIMPPAFLNMRNYSGRKPKDLFLEEHKGLLGEGEKAMKETANSCMLVSTLISTIVFAAALVVPGSSKDTAPQTLIFKRSTWFTVFVVSNAVALFSSSTSIIILLSILTSSYVESKCIRSLQAKMMFGLIALLISITGMVIAFTAATFLIFDHTSTWVPYFTASLASVPVIIFLSLYYKFAADLIRSAYWSKFLFRPSKHKLL